MASEANIQKLLSRGASRSQAVTALNTIGCVADAIDAISAGVFGPVAQASIESKRTFPLISCDSRQGSVLGDDGEDHASSSFYQQSEDGFEGDDHFQPEAGEEVELRLDPYRGLDMRKDRTETIIEGWQVQRTFNIPCLANSMGALGHIACSEVTQSEWMKGVPHGAEQSYLFDVYQSLRLEAVKCPDAQCQHAHTRKGQEFFILFENVQQYLAYLEETLVRTCDACQIRRFCLACGEEVSRKGPVYPRAEVQTLDQRDIASSTIMHCRLSISAALGIGLAHIERAMKLDDLGDPLVEIKTRKIPQKRRRSKQSTKHVPCYEDEDHEYYGEEAPQRSNGVGYAGKSSDDYTWNERASSLQKLQDTLICEALRALRPCLPNGQREYIKLPGRGGIAASGPLLTDHLNEVTVLAHLRRRFLPIASSLLQTRSINDVADRLQLFEELLAWLSILSRESSTVPLVAQPIMRLVKHKIRKFENNNESVEVERVYEASSGPRELVQDVVEQAEALLQSLNKAQRLEEAASKTCPPNSPGDSEACLPASSSKTIVEDESEDNTEEEIAAQNVRILCGSIIESVEAIDNALRAVKGDAFVGSLLASFRGEPSTNQPQELGTTLPLAVAKDGHERRQRAQELAYQAWAKSMVFDEADMTLTPAATIATSTQGLLYSHAYATKIEASRNHNDSKRNLIISRELAGLRSTLPAEWYSTIFVRVDESRLDVLKALIVGPACSPYKDGLFAFDIFLPEQYNAVPPDVAITTTDGGKVRFGPNLYACGKVCLSLLGTWSGPGWQAGKSTLLQVLLSVSSMVMGEEEPAVNEPGWTSMAGSAGSRAYTRNLRRQTVRHAMLNQLKSPTAIWKDIILGHFKHKRASVEKQLNEWLNQDDGEAYCGDGATLISRGRTQGSTGLRNASAEFKKDVQELKQLLQGL